MKRLALAATLGLLAAVASAAPASASTGHHLVIRGSAVCDHDTAEYAVTWTVTNPHDTAGAIGNVRMYPPGRALVALPNRLQPHQSIVGTQRLLGSEHTARLQLDVNWDDGTVTYDHQWPVYIKFGCGKS